MSIDGRTILYGVVGDPVSQVRAPELLNPLLAAAGRNAVVVPLHVPSGRLPEIFASLRELDNLAGLLVTVPHKVEAAGLADRRSPDVNLIGTANVLRRDPDGRWNAANFDGAGFVDGLVAAGHAVEGLDVYLAGAGGAGSAMAVAFLAAGARSLAIQEVDDARATSLLDRLARHWPDRARRACPADLAAAGLIVNATPLGLRTDDPLPIDPAVMATGSIVADIIMDPLETRLLRLAAERGMTVHHGMHMLRSQVASYREFFGWTS